MNIKEWSNNSKNIGIVKHTSSNPIQKETIDDTIQSLDESWLRVSHFSGIVKPTALILATVMAATASFPAMSEVVKSGDEQIPEPIEEVVEEIDYNFEKSLSSMSPEYTKLNEQVSEASVLVVNSHDPNVVKVILNLNSNVLPEIEDYLEQDIKKLVIDKVGGIKSDQMNSAMKIGNEEAGYICLVSIHPESNDIQSPLLSVRYNDYSSISSIYAHELAHCQQPVLNIFDAESLTDYIMSMNEQEVLSDFTSALLIAGKTRNWDFLDNHLEPLRNTTRHLGGVHDTASFLEELKKNTSINELSENMTQKEAYLLAKETLKIIKSETSSKEIHERLNEEQIKREIYYLAQEDPDFIEQALKGEKVKNEYSSKEHEVFNYIKNAESEQFIDSIVEQEFKSLMQSRLNYINYKSLENSPQYINQLLDNIENHSNYSNNKELSQHIKTQKENFEINGEINIKQLADNLGVSLEKSSEARNRYQLNEIKGEEMLMQYMNQEEKQKLDDSGIIQNISVSRKIY